MVCLADALCPCSRVFQCPVPKDPAALPVAQEPDIGDLDPAHPGSFEPMSVLQMVLRNMETDLEHLGPDRADQVRSPLGFHSLDQLDLDHRPLRLRSAFSRRHDLSGFRHCLEDDDDDDDVEILKY
ncbi:hypothetical protein ACOMHN_025062 [Nucella lapillus]